MPSEPTSPDPLAEIAPDIVAHMNGDHAETLRLYARVFAGLAADEAAMTAVDRDGFTMRVRVGVAERDIRLAFPAPVHDADEVRSELVAMAKAARAAR